jgi:N-acetyl-anhydromuramyl-L-alanine amidase AmpD
MELEIEALKQYGVAYHYLIDVSGEIRKLVEESNAAYHTSNRNINSIGIGLIHISGSEYPKDQINSLVSLLTDIVKRRKINLNRIIAASQVDSKKRSDIPKLLSNIREKIKNNLTRH